MLRKKIDFKHNSKKQGHYIMIKDSIQEEDIFVNIYKLRVSKYIKQVLTDLKEKIENNTQ